MTLTLERLTTALKPRQVRYFDQIASTNDAAYDWLRTGAPDGVVVIADEQLHGRGRNGRAWHTPPGVALAVSVVLHPDAADLPRLSMLGALAMAELAEALGAYPVGIKWPNDVQINGLKVSGVLPEARWQGDQLLGVVLGMGVNVRVDFAGTELADKAISLETAVRSKLDRTKLVVMLMERVDYWFNRLGSDALFEAWKRRLNMLGQVVQVNDIHGIAEAVNEQGALLVRDHQGQLQRIVAGDIALGVQR
jgi:BirA family biotin operon repressor/biotin-[acetyl-CoA-carboxylase] ligase